MKLILVLIFSYTVGVAAAADAQCPSYELTKANRDLSGLKCQMVAKSLDGKFIRLGLSPEEQGKCDATLHDFQDMVAQEALKIGKSAGEGAVAGMALGKLWQFKKMIGAQSFLADKIIAREIVERGHNEWLRNRSINPKALEGFKKSWESYKKLSAKLAGQHGAKISPEILDGWKAQFLNEFVGVKSDSSDFLKYKKVLTEALGRPGKFDLMERFNRMALESGLDVRGVVGQDVFESTKDPAVKFSPAEVLGACSVNPPRCESELSNGKLPFASRYMKVLGPDGKPMVVNISHISTTKNESGDYVNGKGAIDQAAKAYLDSRVPAELASLKSGRAPTAEPQVYRTLIEEKANFADYEKAGLAKEIVAEHKEWMREDLARHSFDGKKLLPPQIDKLVEAVESGKATGLPADLKAVLAQIQSERAAEPTGKFVDYIPTNKLSAEKLALDSKQKLNAAETLQWARQRVAGKQAAAVSGERQGRVGNALKGAGAAVVISTVVGFGMDMAQDKRFEVGCKNDQSKPFNNQGCMLGLLGTYKPCEAPTGGASAERGRAVTNAD